MPFDAITSRPYMRLSTADLAAMVDGAAPDLAAIAAELAHRDRKPARVLAMRVASLMEARLSYNGDAIRPAPAPSGAIAKGDHGKLIRANRRQRKAAEKHAPAMAWSPLISEVFGNPMKAARIEALKAEGWQHAATDAGGYMVFERDGARMRVGHHGAIYLGDATWVHLSREERDRLTDAGRPILDTLARRGAAEMKLKAAKAARRAVVKDFPKARADAKIPAFKSRILLGKAAVRSAWMVRVKARAEMAACA